MNHLIDLKRKKLVFSVGAVNEKFYPNETHARVSARLSMLQDLRIIYKEREGKDVYIYLDEDTIEAIRAYSKAQANKIGA